MKRSEFLKSFKIERKREDGIVFYSAKCPFDGCPHEGFHNVLSGNDHGAILATEGDIIVHCRLVHKIEIEDDNAQSLDA
jgi:hypothetical protein